jgi:hypothetical protein
LGAVLLDVIALGRDELAPVNHISRGNYVISGTTVLDDVSIFVKHCLEEGKWPALVHPVAESIPSEEFSSSADRAGYHEAETTVDNCENGVLFVLRHGFISCSGMACINVEGISLVDATIGVSA